MLKWKSITNTNKMVSLKIEFPYFYAKEKISSISCQKCILNEVKLGYGLSLFKSLFISKSCTKFVLFVLLLHICYLKDDNWSRQSFFATLFWNTFVRQRRFIFETLTCANFFAFHRCYFYPVWNSLKAISRLCKLLIEFIHK